MFGKSKPQPRHWLLIVTVVVVLLITVFAWNSATGAASGMEIRSPQVADRLESRRVFPRP